MDEFSSETAAVGKNARASLPLLLSEFLLAIWNQSKDGAVQRRVCVLACLLSICGIAAFIGAVPTRQYGHDIFVLLDNGWRVLNGQRPHVDYYSSLGPVTFLISALGMRLSNYTVDGIGYGNACFGLLIGLWSYGISRGRMESSPRILLTIFLALLVVAPYMLGQAPVSSGHAGVYNRYGYAVIGLVMLEAFQPVGGVKRMSGNWLGGISSGAAVALLLFLKASFFFVALLLIGASLLFWSRTRQRVMGMMLGFLLVALALLAYLRFDIQAVVGDLSMAAGAKSQHASAFGFFYLAGSNAVYLLQVLLLAFAGSLAVDAATPRWLDFRLLFLGALTFAADILLLYSNGQGQALPVIAVFAIILMNAITAHHRTLPTGEARISRPYYAAMLSFGVVLLIPQLASDLAGLTYGAWRKARPSNLAGIVRFTEPYLVPLLLYDDPEGPRSNGRVYATYVNDGIALLRRASGPGETIITVDMANPFTYALSRKPALGGVSFGAYLSNAHHPSDDAFFGNVAIVMVPKHPADSDMAHDGFYKIYAPALHERFWLAAESDWWFLYKRK